MKKSTKIIILTGIVQGVIAFSDLLYLRSQNGNRAGLALIAIVLSSVSGTVYAYLLSKRESLKSKDADA